MEGMLRIWSILVLVVLSSCSLPLELANVEENPVASRLQLVAPKLCFASLSARLPLDQRAGTMRNLRSLQASVGRNLHGLKPCCDTTFTARIGFFQLGNWKPRTFNHAVRSSMEQQRWKGKHTVTGLQGSIRDGKAEASETNQPSRTGEEYAAIRRAEKRAASGIEVLDQRGGILVVNKPFGIRMQGNFEVTVDKLVHALPDVQEARFAHRLDFGTSGVLLVCLNKESAAWARAMFDAKQVQKTYLALLEGTLTDEVFVDAPIAEFAGDGTVMAPRGRRDGSAADFRMMLAAEGDDRAKASQSRVVPLGWGCYMGRPCTKAALEPLTGRRHQLRLHTRHIGHPILGDWTYGNREVAEKGERMMLHAWKLSVPNCPLRLKRQGWVSSGSGESQGVFVRRKGGGYVLEGLEELEAAQGVERWEFLAPDPFGEYVTEYVTEDQAKP